MHLNLSLTHLNCPKKKSAEDFDPTLRMVQVNTEDEPLSFRFMCPECGDLIDVGLGYHEVR